MPETRRPWWKDVWRPAVGIALAGSAAIALPALLMLASFNAGMSSGYREREAHAEIARLSGDLDRELKSCEAEPVRSRLTQCVARALSDHRDDRRDELDLVAQGDMAQWAWWLLFATAVQLPISAFGLLALLVTIRQGQSALRHSETVAATQLRAYLSTRRVRIDEIQPGRWQVQARFLNSGQTPARDVICGVSAHYMEYPLRDRQLPEFDERREVVFAVVAPGGGPRSGQVLALSPQHRAEIAAGRGCIVARVYLSYRIHTGERVREPAIVLIAVGARFDKDTMRSFAPARDFAGPGPAQAPALPSP
jgi:hypothetical protein